MVRKVILIGFIGLLIALSNAMNKQSVETKVKTFTFNGKNVRAALKNYPAYTPAKANVKVSNIFCPNTLTYYCKAGDFAACVSEDVKDSKFAIPEGSKADAIFANDEYKFTCEKVDAKNLVELSVFDFFSEATLKENNLSEEEKKKVYCEVTTEELAEVYMPDVPDATCTDEEKVNEWKIIKKNLQNFASSKKFKINNKEYTIKCENVTTFWERWGTWIVILVVLAAVIGVCYWFLCCDEDDDDEGKDENKAADP